MVTNHTLHGKNIVHMTQGSNTLHFWYDAQNRPALVQFNGTKYAYIHNLQGDIVGLLDSTGTEVVKYIYDPWGKILSVTGSLASTLGTLQPFRYRGYVYDAETGLYYLRSRYYIPTWKRFVNADALVRFNLFTYVLNNPIKFTDLSGLVEGINYPNGEQYYSPSELQSEAVLVREGRGKADGNIPLSYLLAYLDQMVTAGDWKYVDGKMDWKKVDCIGMIRIAYQQYSQKLAMYQNGCPTYVGESVKQAKNVQLLDNEARKLLQQGDVIYWKKTKTGEWYHMGIYVGEYYDQKNGIWYNDAIIEAATGGYVIARSLSDIENDKCNRNTTFYYGQLSRVDYER